VWEIKTTDRFDEWLIAQNDHTRASVLAALIVLRTKGPGLPRPWADTIKGALQQYEGAANSVSWGADTRFFRF
jgi:hypothetical protein